MESPRDPLPAYARHGAHLRGRRASLAGRSPAGLLGGAGGHRPACWAVLVVLVVLVVRRSSHEAHAALAPGGVTYWNPGSSAS